MASLFNTRISDTYSGLIKTIDNAALTASLKELTDGSGLSTGVYMNTAGDFKVTAILEFGSLKDTGENIIISKFVDEADGIANNDNDTTIPTTAAIIDYVAAQITIEDLDFTGDTGSGQIDLDSQIFAIGGTTNEITTVASGQSLTFSLDSTGVNLPDNSTAITQTAGDNSTKIATTSYVDTLDSASDLDFSGNGGNGAVNLNTQLLDIVGATNEITTLANNQMLTISFPTTGVTLPNGSVATTQSAGDNSTKVATTSYVDTLDAASDLDITDGTNTGDINLNTQSLSILGTTNEIDSVVSGQSVTLGLPNQINVNVQGNLTGNVTGDVTGDLTGNSAGTHTGAVIGNVTGNVTGDVTGDLTGNADTATAWETARDLSLTGQATGTISSVDGTNNVSGAVTLDNNSVTGKVLTGLTSPSASSVLATDTIVEGFGKLQSQVNGLAGGLRFIGSWDADTNSPVLSSGGGEAANGTTTSTTANKLVDSSASFTTTVTVGDQVVNQVDGQTALVSNVDSDTTLSLDNDIMLTGEAYTIDNSPFITQGHYYVVSVGGTTSLNGVSNWTIGDWVIAGANNQWTKLDHSQVDGTGTTGNLTKWSSTSVIADSIVSESGTAITVDGSLSTNTNLSSTGDFAVNTNKFTVAAASGNTVVAGTLDVNGTGASSFSGNVNLGDDDKLQLGTSNDLQIYHDGSHSYLKDSGTGDLKISSNTVRIESDGAENMIIASANGAVNLYYNNNQKLATTNTGVSVKGDLTFSTAFSEIIKSDGSLRINIDSNNDQTDRVFIVSTGSNTEMMRVDETGNATFVGTVETTTLKTDTVNNKANSANIIYRTGTNTIVGNNANALVVQDGGNVGIGTDSPSAKLGVKLGTATAVSTIANTTGWDSTYAVFGNPESGSSQGYAIGITNTLDGVNILSVNPTSDWVDTNYYSRNHIFYGGETERMRIDSSGNATFSGANIYNKIQSYYSGSYISGWKFSDYNGGIWYDAGTDDLTLNAGHANSQMLLNSGGAIALTLDSSQNATFAGNVTLEQNSASPVLLVKASGQTSSTAPYSKLVLAAGSASGVDVGSNIMGYRTADFSSAAARSTGLKFGVLQNNVAKDAMWINEAGNVGIGTTPSNYKLDTLAANQYALLLNTSDSNGCFLAIKTNGTAKGYLGTSYHLKSGSPSANDITLRAENNLQFTTGGGTERMRIDSSGNVTIKSGKKLILNNSVNSGEGSIVCPGGGSLALQSYGNNMIYLNENSDIRFSTSSSERMRIDSSGQVLIDVTGTNGSDLSTGGLAYRNNSGSYLQLSSGVHTDAAVAYFYRKDVGGTSVESFGNISNSGLGLVLNGGANSNQLVLAQEGNVGIGTDSPSATLHTNVTGDNTVFRLTRDTGTNGRLDLDFNGANANFDTIYDYTFQTNGTERMRITSGGDVGFNTTFADPDADCLFIEAQDNYALYSGSDGTGTSNHIVFGNGNTWVGSITTNGSATAYNTSSDYRLKEDLQDFKGLDKVSKIPVYDFKWKTDESRSYGVMAHELQEVLPQAVVGEKDAEEMQSVDYSKIVPLLVKSIQELKAEVDLLKQECKCKN